MEYAVKIWEMSRPAGGLEARRGGKSEYSLCYGDGDAGGVDKTYPRVPLLSFFFSGRYVGALGRRKPGGAG